ncbi:MAG TPA: phosphoenolpyruvate kinase, partial [Myxococcota bacterium]|nr:phosphoenolpyruvate kinase [Myxococcota bacterium]
MKTTLSADLLAPIRARLDAKNHAFNILFPGESPRRQPVHTVYGGAHLFKSDTAKKMSNLAVRHLDENAPDVLTFAHALGLTDMALAERIHHRVREKLVREAIEDFRVDFEDGYGNRPDEEEDLHAVNVGQQLAAGVAA